MQHQSEAECAGQPGTYNEALKDAVRLKELKKIIALLNIAEFYRQYLASAAGWRFPKSDYHFAEWLVEREPVIAAVMAGCSVAELRAEGLLDQEDE